MPFQRFRAGWTRARPGRMLTRMQDLSSEDRRHLDAADGWLGLGNLHEARAELDQITATEQSHPDVLQLRWNVTATAGAWADSLDIAMRLTRLAPDRHLGSLHLALSLCNLGRFEDAIPVLEQAIARFGERPEFSLTLGSCYAKRGDMVRARQNVERAVELAEQKEALDRLGGQTSANS
jgi:predicted Zn-dependent protease